MVALPASALAPFERFSLYNSPYRAHDRGRAIDLYPDDRRGEPTPVGPSPVAGEVIETRTVACPDRPYAVGEDHLIVVRTDPESYAGGRLARILHVDPTVAPGDRVAVGDPLGPTIRSGYFGRWVANHLHLGFRPPDANPVRAGGSLPLAVDIPVAPIDWDGTGTVVDAGPTYVLLDAPDQPDPSDDATADPDPSDDATADPDPSDDADTDGVRWTALGSDGGVGLDGGLAHYGGGGAFGPVDGSLSLLGAEIGRVADSPATGSADGDRAGPHLDWADVAVLVDGVRATGLSLFAARVQFGAKVVFHEGHEFTVGDEVRVDLAPVDDRIRLDE